MKTNVTSWSQLSAYVQIVHTPAKSAKSYNVTILFWENLGVTAYCLLAKECLTREWDPLEPGRADALRNQHSLANAQQSNARKCLPGEK